MCVCVKFFLRGAALEKDLQVQFVTNKAKKLKWPESISQIMYQFANQANQATSTKIRLTFINRTIDKKDQVVVTKLLDQNHQIIDFPLDNQKVEYEPNIFPHHWHITLLIQRPQNLPLPLLAISALPRNDIIPSLPVSAPLYSGQVVPRRPYRSTQL